MIQQIFGSFKQPQRHIFHIFVTLRLFLRQVAAEIFLRIFIQTVLAVRTQNLVIIFPLHKAHGMRRLRPGIDKRAGLMIGFKCVAPDRARKIRPAQKPHNGGNNIHLTGGFVYHARLFNHGARQDKRHLVVNQV